MSALREGNVVWTFPDGWVACKYDEWAFYQRQFQGKSGGSAKAVDFVAVDDERQELWLIEAKDYTRQSRASTKEPLPQEVARKARDTLAGLLAARVRAQGDERTIAHMATGATSIRVVLHLELPTAKKRSYGKLLDPADVLQKLKGQVKAIDPHPKVVDVKSSTLLAWTAEWKPE